MSACDTELLANSGKVNKGGNLQVLEFHWPWAHPHSGMPELHRPSSMC